MKRERVFFLLAEPRWNFFKVGFTKLFNDLTIQPVNMSYSYFCICQGFKMFSKEEMASWPEQEWMRGSKKPEVHTWLSKTQGANDAGRLRLLGNIVIPQMAFCAANLLSEMWQ